jgi:hypothetical protein
MDFFVRMDHRPVFDLAEDVNRDLFKSIVCAICGVACCAR